MIDPRLMQGMAGHAAGMTGQVLSPLSMLDAPGRAVRGGLMGMMGGQVAGPTNPEGDPTLTTASFLPALVGVAAGGVASMVPGLGAAAPWIGAGAAGLTQQLGEMIDPQSFASVSPGQLNEAMGAGSSPVGDLITGAATDPLTWAGALGGMMGGGRAAGLAGAAEAGAAPEAEMLAQHAVGMPASQAPTGLSPGWLEQANQASMGGYRNDLSQMIPNLTDTQMDKGYKLVNPGAGQALQGLGYMDAAPSVGPKAGTLNYQMPSWAEVRGGNVMPTGRTPQVPADPMAWLNDAQMGDEAMQGMGTALAGGGDQMTPLAKFLKLRQGTGLGQMG